MSSPSWQQLRTEARYKLLWKALRTSRSVDPQNMLSRAAETYSNDKF